MVIGSSVNSGTGAVAGRGCDVLSAASESVLRVRSFPSDPGPEARNSALLRPRLAVNRVDVNRLIPRMNLDCSPFGLARIRGIGPTLPTIPSRRNHADTPAARDSAA